MQASLDWSYELLSDPKQTLLRRLAPFAGGWTLEAAEAVCVDPGTPASGVLDLLTRRVDSSLVFVTEQGGAARYRRLETVRQYALEKLRASRESGDVQRRHAAYYLAHVKAVGQYDRESKQWIASELDNARAALRWSLESGEAELAAHLAEALAWFWYLHGYWHEGRNWHHQVSALLAGAPHTAVHAQIMFSEGHIAQYQGDVVTARVLMEQSVALCRQLGDREGMLRPLHDLARLAREAGDFARARELFGEVLALAGEVNALHFRGYAQIGLGLVAVIEEDVREATMWLTAGRGCRLGGVPHDAHRGVGGCRGQSRGRDVCGKRGASWRRRDARRPPP